MLSCYGYYQLDILKSKRHAVYLYPKNIFDVKGKQFKSPLHQHSVKIDKYSSSNEIIHFKIKEEIHNRFKLISEERVKKFEQNSENLMKIGWKIRKLWHFEVSQIFKKHFLTSRYEYANEWVDDVITSQYVWKILLFFLKFKLNLFRISPLRVWEETIKIVTKLVQFNSCKQCKCGVVFSKVLSDPVIVLTLWSIISLLDEPFSLNVGTMDF